ncbi:MAG: DEAD/DEAH box helicase [Kiloniellales bacterium]|nr:DEAD/DEAH box helicase [Kiloniellales bacterium]
MLLRPRQTEFVDRVVAALETHGNTLGVAPTGAGKTICMGAVLGRLLDGGHRALVLQHRDELTRQNVEKCQAINPGLDPSVVDASGKDFGGRAIFAMVPTLARPRNLDRLPPVDLIVVDEAHHAPAETYRRIIDRAQELNSAVKLLGLTATPRRADKKALREIFSNVADQVLVGELIASGHLVRPRTFVIDLGLQNQLLAAKRRAADFDPEEINAIMNHAPVNAAVVEHWSERAADRQTVAFTSTVSHAAELAAAFRAKGITAAVVHGDMPAGERVAILEAYDRGAVQVLANCFVLGEGWDHQPTSCVLLLRPTSFKSPWTQMIGRGLRPVDPRLYPGVEKSDCLVLDFGVSTILHGSLEQSVDLDAKLAAVARERNGNGVAATRSCPSCSAEVPAVAVDCPMCGERFFDEIARLLNFELVEIDLLERSNFAWTDVSRETDGSLMVAHGFEGFAVVQRDGATWVAVAGMQKREGQKGTAEIIAKGDRSVCLARADDFMNATESAETAHKSRAWTQQAPTPKQWQYLPSWVNPDGLTRYGACCHLDLKFNGALISRALTGPVWEVA